MGILCYHYLRFINCRVNEIRSLAIIAYALLIKYGIIGTFNAYIVRLNVEKTGDFGKTKVQSKIAITKLLSSGGYTARPT